MLLLSSPKLQRRRIDIGFRELIFNQKKIMENANQYNISIQTKLGINYRECCDSCGHPIINALENS